MQADSDSIRRRLRIVRGQIEGILNMVEEDRYCIEISNQLMAATASLKAINRDVLSAHLSHCVADSLRLQDEKEIRQKMEEMDLIIKKLSK